MKERPIIFNTEMVKAILDGRKTVTRRPVKIATVKNPTKYLKENSYKYPENSWLASDGTFIENINCPFGQIGDRLYVRETWCKTDNGIAYKSTTDSEGERCRIELGYQWKPSIHMPKRYARIWLEITDVMVERVQDIDDTEAFKEGIAWDDACPEECSNGYYPGAFERPIEAFEYLWDSIYKNWADNPWVWVI